MTTYNTPKGALIEITALEFGGFSAAVNGKAHTFSKAAFVATDSVAGPHVALAGMIKASIPAGRVADIAAWFAAATIAQHAAVQAAKSTAAKEYYVESRMSDMESRFSVN